MDEEMNNMGLDSVEVDPVSGNEIPVGGTAEGVRDDVEANLSEGEYVVPTHIVNFFGVKFFNDLRKKAEKGLAEMDSEGQIGGEPAEEVVADDMEVGLEDEVREFANGGMVNDFDGLVTKIKDLVGSNPELRGKLSNNGINFADGGLVDFVSKYDPSAKSATGADGNTPEFNPQDWQTVGGSYFNDSNSFFAPNAPESQANQEYRTYVNDRGETKSILFINGEPQEAIPSGFKPQGETNPNSVVENFRNSQGGDQEGDNDYGDRITPPGQNYYNMTNEQLAKVGDNAFGSGFGKKGMERVGGLASDLLGGNIAGVLGTVVGGGAGLLPSVFQANAVNSTLAAAEVARSRGETSLANQLTARAEEMTGQMSGMGQKVLEWTTPETILKKHAADYKTYKPEQLVYTPQGTVASTRSRSSGPTIDTGKFQNIQRDDAAGRAQAQARVREVASRADGGGDRGGDWENRQTHQHRDPNGSTVTTIGGDGSRNNYGAAVRSGSAAPAASSRPPSSSRSRTTRSNSAGQTRPSARPFNKGGYVKRREPQGREEEPEPGPKQLKLSFAQKKNRGVSGGQSMLPAFGEDELSDIKKKLEHNNSWTYSSQIEDMVNFLEETSPNEFSAEVDPKINGLRGWSDPSKDTQKYGDHNYWEVLQKRALRLENKEDRSEEEDVWLRLFQETSRRRAGS